MTEEEWLVNRKNCLLNLNFMVCFIFGRERRGNLGFLLFFECDLSTCEDSSFCWSESN